MARKSVVRHVVNCDRCKAEVEVEETGLGVDHGAAIGEHEVAFRMDLSHGNLELDAHGSLVYDDLCEKCRKRLGALMKEAGPVSRSRRSGPRKKKTDASANGEKQKKAKKAKPPAKPEIPVTA